MTAANLTATLWQHGIFLPHRRFELLGYLEFEVPIRLLACSLDSVGMGAYSYVAAGSRLERVKVGRFCSIADEVRIGLGSHPMGWLSTNPFSYFPLVPGLHVETPPFTYDWQAKPTELGHDVWIGARVMIPGGVKIGTGAVVAAGSIVTKDVPPYAVVAGNPARIVKQRFADELIADLLASNWWQYDWPKIFREQRADLPPWDDPRALLIWLDGRQESLPVLSIVRKRLRRDGAVLRVETVSA
jgi:acetyltransferase-like isoleucine patch superfamily enzyme